jgi:hypothetical protein
VFHRTVTQILAITDPHRFSFGTVPQVESTLKRVFTVAPTNQQIETDIFRLPTILNRIIEVKGAIVPEMSFRSGHRLLRHDKKGILKTALKRSSRVATYQLPDMHLDAQMGIEKLKYNSIRSKDAADAKSKLLVDAAAELAKVDDDAESDVHSGEDSDDEDSASDESDEENEEDD